MDSPNHVRRGVRIGSQEDGSRQGIRERLRPLLAWLRRRWLLIVVVLAFIIFVAFQYRNVVQLGATLVRGSLTYLLVALALQMVYYTGYAFLYRLAFETVEVEARTLELLPVLFASFFLKVVVPSGGVSGVAIFVDDAARRGQSPARAAEGSLWVLVSDLATMVPLIVFGLGYLAFEGVVALYQVLGALFCVLVASAMAGVLLLGRLQPDRLRAALAQAQRTINNLAARFNRPPLLPGDWAERNAAECIGAACNIARHPRPLTRTLVVAFTVHLVNTASLYAVALAYQQRLAVGAVVAAFAMDIVFSVVNIIPNGIGVAEGVMTLVFTSVGVSLAEALVISIAFRGLNVWIPLIIGFFLLPRVRSFSGRNQPEEEE
jgi:uncharacterized membrane protein YbhN (UPF0104 family)